MREKLPGSASSEAYLHAASRALFVLCLVMGGVFLIGLVFLAWLKISSGFWFMWGPLYLMSVTAVFCVAPALAIMLLGWALVGRHRLGHSPRPLRMAALSLAGIVADVLLFYALAASIA